MNKSIMTESGLAVQDNKKAGTYNIGFSYHECTENDAIAIAMSAQRIMQKT